MEPVTVDEFARFLGLTTPQSDILAVELQEDLDAATEYVESQVGPIADRVVRQSMCRSAILQLGKHLRQVRGTATTRGSMMGSAEQVPSVVGYLVPNRVKTMIDAMRYDDPSMIGIG